MCGSYAVRDAMPPPKVEVGTTLSGQFVTGSQMERSPRVSGNEPGACRVVTGTEYVGTEQYATFCEGRPAASAPKVGMSATSRGMWVSGNEVGRSQRVTGDEAGSCKPVTGTEYLGSEKFAEFCPSQPLPERPEKVSIGATERKGMVVTGSDEARANHATGAEAGARRAITGSQYADAGVARLTINGAPSKVALTHTIAGRPVSGTEVGHSVKVTGDEAGACRGISGTEYLSNEQFQTVCGTRPAPTPTKVGVDRSRGGLAVTGNLVDRSEKVTGNEPGSCQRLTGSQYGESRLCGGGVDKVREMHTLSGRALTGTTVAHAPKMSGDERGGCLPVTGTEYHGQEQYQAYC
ncbi:MAG: CsoS2 family carboxysome shell protein [Xanthomonadaceae bacterium]|nr:CsoS2 family carboxysome shell protein [Xanthomonadaceae bacterium]